MVDKINLATPIAHEAAGTYQAYYSGSTSVFELTGYFDRAGCKGIRLKKNSLVASATSAQFNLFALTDGFLTYSDNSLKLRLPTELQARDDKQYGSGVLLRALLPGGPQLRHVVYKFLSVTDPFDTAAKPSISSLLADTTHPLRRLITTTQGDKPITLGTHLDANAANSDSWIAGFQAGTETLFVKAGDVIANFFDEEIEIQFCDSCGGPTTSNLNAVTGRETNPSYYIYKLFRDTAHSNQLTEIDRQADALSGTAHPFIHLYRTIDPVLATANADQFLDLTAAIGPPARLLTVECTNSANDVLADSAIGFGGLGQWHKSRNASSETASEAPVKWRLYGKDAADTDAIRRGTLVTQLAPPATSALLPGGAAFDHDLTPPTDLAADRVTRIWNLYHPIFNAVAKALQLPCEILATIACTETGIYFDNDSDVDIIRMEPLKDYVAVSAGTPLARYKALAGQNTIVNNQTVYASGANAELPRPWNGASFVKGTSGLTWSELRDLIANNDDILVSPGCTQVLVGSARSNLEWARNNFGTAFLTGISITIANDVGANRTLSIDDPPDNLGSMFQSWFGVTLDAAGAATTNTASVDANLTRFKRALHNIFASAAYIKRNYNYVPSRGNKITDFDPPTVFSGYNDGATTLSSDKLAKSTSSNDVKWQKLYGVITYDSNYPKNGSRSYNRIVRYFNNQGYLAANPVATRPAVRLWPEP